MKRCQQDLTEGSADSTTEGQDDRRPRRRCRQNAHAVIEEQLFEELEDRQAMLDQRTLRLKEKNKRAQQRFRERQKEKSQAATVQVQRLQQQVAELKARTAAANERCQLLEKLLMLKDGAAKTDLATLDSDLSAIKRDPETLVFIAYDGFTALPEGEFVMQLRGCAAGAPLHVAKHQVATMGLQDHIALYTTYVEKLREGLQEARGNSHSPAAKRLQGLVNELMAWCAWVNRLAPHIMPQMRQLNLDGTSLAGPPESYDLVDVLRRQGLSKDQTLQIVAARRFCLSTLATLMRERLGLLDTLKGMTEGGPSYANMYNSHPKMVELQRRLKQNVDAELRAFHTFMSSTLRRVLNPVQTAAVVVSSFPYVPDVMDAAAALEDAAAAADGSDDDLLDFDPVPAAPEAGLPPLPLAPADSLGPALDALWGDIFLS